MSTSINDQSGSRENDDNKNYHLNDHLPSRWSLSTEYSEEDEEEQEEGEKKKKKFSLKGKFKKVKGAFKKAKRVVTPNAPEVPDPLARHRESSPPAARFLAASVASRIDRRNHVLTGSEASINTYAIRGGARPQAQLATVPEVARSEARPQARLTSVPEVATSERERPQSYHHAHHNGPRDAPAPAARATRPVSWPSPAAIPGREHSYGYGPAGRAVLRASLRRPGHALPASPEDVMPPPPVPSSASPASRLPSHYADRPERKR